MKKLIIIAITTVILIGGSFIIFRGNNNVKVEENNVLQTEEPAFDIKGKIKFEDGYYLEISDSNKVFKEGGFDFRSYGAVKDYGDHLYFSSLANIYQSKNDGTEIKCIYSRQPSGVNMEITKVDNEWIYFEIMSEDGISVNRIKKDGSGYEHLDQKGETDK